MPDTAPLGVPANTVVTSSLPLEQTAPSTAAVSGVEPAAPRAPEPASMRTTVLPRVEIVDARPRLVVEGRRRFEPVRLLGEGGHGEVTGARDHDIGRNVAIKRLRSDVSLPGAALRFAEEV